jgi:hypothetical protein
MDSVDNSVKAEMKHMEYEEDLGCSNKEEAAVHDDIVIDQKLESRVKYVASIVFGSICEIQVLTKPYSGEKLT